MLSSESYRERLAKIDRIRDLEKEVENLDQRLSRWNKYFIDRIRMLHEYLGVDVVPPMSKLEKKK